MNYIIASSKEWRPGMVENVQRRVGGKVTRVVDPGELSLSNLDKINPELIFFPHWSEIIPSEIHSRYECVIFHMTDLPFGRGGSPLQNLISRGIYETKISAIRCVEELDAGPVYMKRDLSLYGSAQEIYMRASEIIEDMIVTIITDRPEPKEQEGDVVVFKRRKREDGNIAHLSSLEQVHDFIRMLDADRYPRAYLETEHMVLEFSRSSLRNGHI